MKRIPLTVITLAFLLAPLAIYAAPNVYQLKVDGLACPFCAYGIEKQLSTLQGVQKVDIELKEGLVLVTMAEKSTLTETQAAEAVRDAGFTLRGFSQTQGGE